LGNHLGINTLSEKILPFIIKAIFLNNTSKMVDCSPWKPINQWNILSSIKPTEKVSDF
jgi:hypothetical protein